MFLLIYVFNVRPLRKLRKGASQFSINHENPPILIKSQDEYGELAKTLNVIGAELSKFDEYQRKFISNISHDFRSPLTSIQGYVQAMKDGVIPADNQEKYLDIILYETERLTKLTSNLIDMNNYDRDNIMLEQESFDIHKAVKMTCESLEGTASNKKITFTYNFCEPKNFSFTPISKRFYRFLEISVITQLSSATKNRKSACIPLPKGKKFLFR